jgi:DNA-binding NarL/FixJ family response regulator
MKNILLVEDDALTAALLKKKLIGLDNYSFSGNYESLEEMLEDSAVSPDVILLDIGLPGMDGISGIPYIRKKFKKASIIINSVTFDSSSIIKAFKLGAKGYIEKAGANKNLFQALDAVNAGEYFMTPTVTFSLIKGLRYPILNLDILTRREKTVGIALMEGLNYQKIADSMGISINTIRKHIKSIYKKLQVNTRHEFLKKLELSATAS